MVTEKEIRKGGGGAQVLAAVEKELRREVAMGEAERVAAVLWIAHTYRFSGFKLTPRLFATSVDPGSGKSTLLSTVAQLACNGKLLKRVTTAYLARLTKGEEGKPKPPKPTLVLDQLDNSIHKQKTGELIDSLCAGGEKGALYGLTEIVKGEKGQEQREPVDLDLFYPVALGKIGDLPDRALADRCITLRMHPATEAEDARLAREATGEVSEVVQGRLADWMDREGGSLGEARPEMPEGFRGRTRDKWRPLLAVAELAGGNWPARARAAAEALEMGPERAEPEHLGTLRRLVTAVEGWSGAVIFGEELRARGFQDVPGGGALLPKVGLISKPQRRGDKVARGFKLADIHEAAARYRVVTGVSSVSEMPDAA